MRDNSWQDVYEQLVKKREEAKKKFEQAEAELKKAQDILAARKKELELCIKRLEEK